MSRLFSLFLVLIPTVAGAAEPDESSLVDQIDFDLPTYSVDADTGALLGYDECEELGTRSTDVEISFTLNVDPTESEGSVERLAAVWLYELGPSDGAIDCDASSCIPLDDEVTTTSSSVTIDLDPQTLLQGAGCEEDRDLFVRIELVEDLDDDDDLSLAEARVRLDVTGPEQAPRITDGFATDDTLELDLDLDDTSDDAERWYIGWGQSTATSSAEVEQLGSVATSVTAVSLDGLELPVDESIVVYVWGRDDAGNDGALSPGHEVQPLLATDYWETYGRDGASCATAGGTTPGLVLFLLVLVLLFRRVRRILPVAIVVVGVVMAAPAAADDGEVELRLGTYTPGITGDPLFAQFFGTHLRWMVSVDGGWLFANHRAVDLGVDLGLGFTSFGGSVQTEDGVVIDGASSLTLVPMRLGLRAVSGEWSRWLVIGARAGLTGAYWRFGNSVGVSVAEDGSIGRGINWGWYSALKLGIDLTGAEKESAAKLRNTWRVSKTTLFVEGAYSDVDSFGASGMDFGDLQLNAGLGFSF